MWTLGARVEDSKLSISSKMLEAFSFKIIHLRQSNYTNCSSLMSSEHIGFSCWELLLKKPNLSTDVGKNVNTGKIQEGWIDRWGGWEEKGSKHLKEKAQEGLIYSLPSFCFPSEAPWHKETAKGEHPSWEGALPVWWRLAGLGPERRRHFPRILRQEGVVERKLIALVVLLSLCLRNYPGCRELVTEVDANI